MLGRPFQRVIGKYSKGGGGRGGAVASLEYLKAVYSFTFEVSIYKLYVSIRNCKSSARISQLQSFTSCPYTYTNTGNEIPVSCSARKPPLFAAPDRGGLGSS